jgi:flagellar hook protein FlgE
MVRSLYSGISGMQQLQEKMDVIGNNIANTNTTGYKSARISFEDSFSQTLRASTPANATTSNTSAMQIGSGVVTGAIQSNFTPGIAAQTNNPDNLYIDGNGFFMVRDPISGEQFATRSGEFHFDTQGFLVTDGSFFRVQGYSSAADLATPDTVNTSTIGDIQLDTADRNSPLTAYSIDKQGSIRVTVDDTSIPTFTRGQVLLQNFKDPLALVKEGNNLYSGIIAAGPLGGGSPQPAAAQTNGLGTIKSGFVELSNVDLANQFADLIITQRSFQAAARVITTSDEMLQETVNLKR